MNRFFRVFSAFVFVPFFSMAATLAESPRHEAEMVFPLHPKHNHAPGIVECPNGDLLVSWYRGSGERRSDDVAVYGARRRKGSTKWSDAFLMADHPEFPDCNTCMMIDAKHRLWLFWPIILDNQWESCLTNFKVSTNYTADGPPRWDRKDVIFLKPDDFSEALIENVTKEYGNRPLAKTERGKQRLERFRKRARNKLNQRLGWQPRCKPTVLPSGRILLPLYSDTYSISLMAVSDDEGKSWYAGKPLIGVGAIQPTVLRRNNGTLLAYMRENGPKNRVRVSESTDDGISWGPVGVTDFPNPGAGVDGVRLANGHWIFVYNDTTLGRNRLAVSLSDDEGKSWKWKRYLERHKNGAYHYPVVIQSKDGTIHTVYSYFVRKGDKQVKSMKHAAFNEAWVQQQDGAVE